ncbi:MAG: nucleotide sugar dehydrogenase, partial [Euryarchaeota archaeon]|nr:nucleotide sugar dehydrogenase [Euryarchaeota archaeon]
MPGKRIAVVGLGYVGLPLACLFAEKGHGAIGIDTDEAKVDLVNRGQSPFPGKEPGLAELLSEVVRDGRLRATSDL